MLTKTAGSVKTRYSYNAANQLVSDGTFDYTYDKVGNLLKKQSDGGSVSYAYNARNLLESWTDGEHSESYRYNAATGMVYFRARFYEPEMNRFSQKDLLRGSMSTPQTLNRYVYCINDPVNFIDPSGMRLVENDPREVRSDLIVPTGRAGTSGPSTNTNVSAKSAAQTAQNVRVQTRLEAIDERDSGSNSPSVGLTGTKITTEATPKVENPIPQEYACDNDINKSEDTSRNTSWTLDKGYKVVLYNIAVMGLDSLAYVVTVKGLAGALALIPATLGGSFVVAIAFEEALALAGANIAYDTAQLIEVNDEYQRNGCVEVDWTGLFVSSLITDTIHEIGEGDEND